MVASSPLAYALGQIYTLRDLYPRTSQAWPDLSAAALGIGRWYDRPADRAAIVARAVAAVRQWGAASRADALEAVLRALTD